MANLKTDFCGVPFHNPFILASSPPTDEREMTARGFEAGWAGAVLKTTYVKDFEMSLVYPLIWSMNPGPGMIGMHNIDVLSVKPIDEIAEDIFWLKQRFPEHRVISSLMGHSQEEWNELVSKSEQAGADLIEASISCPQGAALEGEEGEAQGWMVSQDPHLTEKVTRWLVNATTKVPVYTKISSLVTDITAIAKAIERAGADAVCAIDSVEAILGFDPENFSPLPSVDKLGSKGGFTGRAIKPIALRCVADIAGAVKMPISGVGGIYTWRDALDMLLVGASTVQVCTAVLHKGFPIIDDLCDGLSRYLDSHGYENPRDVVGLGLPKVVEHEGLTHGIKVYSRINQEECIHCGLCYTACTDGGHTAIDFHPNRRVEVSMERCIGCGLCAQVCPVPGCITIS